MKDLDKIITDTKTYACVDCGKCTSVCPVSRYDCDFSPRMLAYDAIHESGPEVLREGQLWSCLTCAACERICPSGVKYSEFVRSLHGEAYKTGITGQCTHGGALQSLMRIMASDELHQSRLDWVPKQIEIADTSEVYYFVGCAPYFDTFFADLGVKTLRAPRASIAILNRLGIVPALSPNERCCGHDLLSSGDIDSFRKLALRNMEEIAKTGAKRVVTACPEGYHTLKMEYPRHLGDTGFEVVHVMQLLAEAVSDGKLKFEQSVNKKVVYHDPCRLGRMSGIYDEPRAILGAIPGLELVEMKHHRANALCCGTQAWTNCGMTSRQIQGELLREARATGAETLLTACPKCQIHLKCAMKDEKPGQEIQIGIEDFTSFVVTALWSGRRSKI